jgi:hypothetical protein
MLRRSASLPLACSMMTRLFRAPWSCSATVSLLSRSWCGLRCACAADQHEAACRPDIFGTACLPLASRAGQGAAWPALGVPTTTGSRRSSPRPGSSTHQARHHPQGRIRPRQAPPTKGRPASEQARPGRQYRPSGAGIRTAHPAPPENRTPRSQRSHSPGTAPASLSQKGHDRTSPARIRALRDLPGAASFRRGSRDERQCKDTEHLRLCGRERALQVRLLTTDRRRCTPRPRTPKASVTSSRRRLSSARRLATVGANTWGDGPGVIAVTCTELGEYGRDVHPLARGAEVRDARLMAPWLRRTRSRSLCFFGGARFWLPSPEWVSRYGGWRPVHTCPDGVIVAVAVLTRSGAQGTRPPWPRPTSTSSQTAKPRVQPRDPAAYRSSIRRDTGQPT